jgi:hypothetical protein
VTIPAKNFKKISKKDLISFGEPDILSELMLSDSPARTENAGTGGQVEIGNPSDYQIGRGRLSVWVSI